MLSNLATLFIGALVFYILVLWTHLLRHRFGLAYFYALLGGLTAVMSWVTDAGASISIAAVTFMVGSTVFYTAILLGVFVVYVFDGPRATRLAISIVAGVSVLVPLIAYALHTLVITGLDPAAVPMPSLRINSASVITTVMDLFFLAVVWEILGKPGMRLRLGLRAFLTLLGVMMLDVLLFNTGAFLGTPGYLSIMGGTFLSRLIICIFAFLILYLYILNQNRRKEISIENRPILSILSEVDRVKEELNTAKLEIKRRMELEREKEELISRLQRSLARVQHLEGLLPVCSSCKRIRIDPCEDELERWVSMEQYIHTETTVEISHGLCPDCARKLYGDAEGAD
ncbi:MAG: hypothetical protein GF388_10900 [Candidatus Aegiribacteria sp.]|nr:hypothetical protein [Candidatus Aegiribacteria sp.]MBD3295515.1 hypothetical protein [Candidatus Fermentibacteria bacterium]